MKFTDSELNIIQQLVNIDRQRVVKRLRELRNKEMNALERNENMKLEALGLILVSISDKLSDRELKQLGIAAHNYPKPKSYVGKNNGVAMLTSKKGGSDE